MGDPDYVPSVFIFKEKLQYLRSQRNKTQIKAKWADMKES